jgi:hypothetical protein
MRSIPLKMMFNQIPGVENCNFCPLTSGVVEGAVGNTGDAIFHATLFESSTSFAMTPPIRFVPTIPGTGAVLFSMANGHGLFPKFSGTATAGTKVKREILVKIVRLWRIHDQGIGREPPLATRVRR